MPAQSKKQQRIMAMAYRHKRNGTLPDEPHLRRLVEDMSEEDLKDFASTKHAELPERVEKAASDGYRDGYLQKEGVTIRDIGILGGAQLMQGHLRGKDVAEHQGKTLSQEQEIKYLDGERIPLSSEGYSERTSGIASTLGRHAYWPALAGVLGKGPIKEVATTLGAKAVSAFGAGAVPWAGAGLAVVAAPPLIADYVSGAVSKPKQRWLATDNNRVTNLLSRATQGMYSNPNLRANVTGHTDSKDVKGGGGTMHMASPEAESIRRMNRIKREQDEYIRAVNDAKRMEEEWHAANPSGGGPATPFAGSDIIARIRAWLRERMKPV